MNKLMKFIPNTITLSRFVMSLGFSYCILKCFLYGNNNNITLFTLFVLICASDMVDGKLARKMGFTSKIGAKLDVTVDLIFLLTSYISLIVTRMLPIWFLGFVIFKFTEFVLTSNFMLKLRRKETHPFIFDKVGRIVSASFFIVPLIECIYKLAAPNSFYFSINYVLYLLFAAGLYSSFLRIKSCVTAIKLERRYSL